MAFRSVAPLLALLLGGCAGREATEPTFETFEIEASVNRDFPLVTPPALASQCSQPLHPELHLLTLEVRVNGSDAWIEFPGQGCTLHGHVEGAVISADGEHCMLGPGELVDDLAVVDRWFWALRLDREEASFEAGYLSLHEFSNVTEYMCGIAKGRLASAEPSGPGTRLKYEGTSLDSFATEPGSPECAESSLTFDTSGALVVFPGETEDERVIREEGIGCSVHLTRGEDGVFSGDGKLCLFDGRVDLRDFGVTARHFDTYRFDEAAGRLDASGRNLRMTREGEKESCFEYSLVIQDDD